MPSHTQSEKDKRRAESEFIMRHTTAAERAGITRRSETSPGQKSAEKRADRGGNRKDARQALQGPAKAARAGQLSRAKRNAKKGR